MTPTESATEEFIIWYANNIDRTSDRALIRAKVTELLKQRDTTLIEAAVKEVENMKVVTHGDYHDHHLGHILNKRIDQVITALRELNKAK
mgnify:FL=1